MVAARDRFGLRPGVRGAAPPPCRRYLMPYRDHAVTGGQVSAGGDSALESTGSERLPSRCGRSPPSHTEAQSVQARRTSGCQGSRAPRCVHSGMQPTGTAMSHTPRELGGEIATTRVHDIRSLRWTRLDPSWCRVRNSQVPPRAAESPRAVRAPIVAANRPRRHRGGCCGGGLSRPAVPRLCAAGGARSGHGSVGRAPGLGAVRAAGDESGVVGRAGKCFRRCSWGPRSQR